MAEQLQPKRIERLDLLTNPVFWAVHSYEQTRADNWIEDYFNLSPSELERFWQRELPSIVPGEPHRFPCYCFPLPLQGGCAALVEYEAYPDDFGIAYYVSRSTWEVPLLLSRYPSAFDWPPLRWDEVVAIAQTVQDHTKDTRIRLAALPLLFSGTWLSSDDDLDEVRTRLRLAWVGLGVVNPAHLDGMVVKMIEAQGIHEPWRLDNDLGWVNHGWNYRNPKHSGPMLFKHVKEFFTVISGTSAI